MEPLISFVEVILSNFRITVTDVTVRWNAWLLVMETAQDVSHILEVSKSSKCKSLIVLDIYSNG